MDSRIWAGILFGICLGFWALVIIFEKTADRLMENPKRPKRRLVSALLHIDRFLVIIGAGFGFAGIVVFFIGPYIKS